MGSLYGVLKRAYKFSVPAKLRDAAYHAAPPPFRRMRESVLAKLQRGAKHDEIYDAEYYAKFVEPGMAGSAAEMAASLLKEFSPSSVVDVGCGTGTLIMALQERGVQCVGLEHAAAALEICSKRGLQVRPFDLESAEPCDLKADLAVSTEVAEHLPEAFADSYVSRLCSIAPIVVLTAAPPTEGGGMDHVNEQPNDYWIKKFESIGHHYQNEISMRLRKQWDESKVSGIYARSLMVFNCSKDR